MVKLDLEAIDQGMEIGVSKCDNAPKESSGSSPCQRQASRLRTRSQLESSGLKGNLRKVLEATDTGNLSSDLGNESECSLSSDASGPSMLNSLGLPRPKNMFGRKTHELKEHSSQSERDQLEGTPKGTTKSFGSMPKRVTLTLSVRQFEFNIIAPFGRLLQITQRLKQWKEAAPFIGARLAPGRVDGPGRKLEWMLILKIQEPSFGADTVVNYMLYSMNFEEEWTSLIYSGGLTDIQSLWKSKAPPQS